MPAKIKLADALLRRKELQAKVKQVDAFKAKDVFEIKVQRTKAHEGIDDVIANIPKLTLAQVTAEYDYYARALRQIDSVIQHANWNVEVDVPDRVMDNYEPAAKP
jgi:hypothetical protein